MDLAQDFAGFDDLDSRPWAELHHAYGTAEDVPAILRALAGGDEDAEGGALSELWSSIIHQGTVYRATAEAVPFLARMAAAGIKSSDLLVLLGSIAETEDEHEVGEPGACRSAVAAQLPLMLPMIESEDPEIRRAAAWTAAQTRAAAPVLPVLLRCWTQERTPSVRAELLAGMVHLDPAGSTDAALESIGPDQPFELRVVAVLACLDAGLPWSAAHRDALLALLPAETWVYERFDLERTEPLTYAVDALLRRDTDEDRDAAYELLEAALRSAEPDGQAEALRAADHACTISRSAPGRLAAPLVALLDDAAHTERVLEILGKLGEHAAAAAPALAALVAEDGDLADAALAELVHIAPEPAAPLLARDLTRWPRALESACGFSILRPLPVIAFAPELLDAIRTRLPLADPESREAASLLAMLTHWGPAAAPALPELTAALERYPSLVPKALAAVCPPEERERIAGLLRGAADSGPQPGRHAAAEALYDLTGDQGPLVREVTALLAEGVDSGAATHVGRLGPDARALAPRLRAGLSAPGEPRTAPQLDAAIAVALWRLTGAADEAVAVLKGVFAVLADDPWVSMWSARGAIDAAAELGPAGADLGPALEAFVDDVDKRPSAFLALLAVGHDVDREAAADALLSSAEQSSHPGQALAALAALGPAVLTPPVTARLTALAERDLRVVTPSSEVIDGSDQAVRERARALLAQVSPRAASPADGR
ncbi:hypothetical protein AB0M39_06330 [Streptomyces sp. NPDC051907]|uniref:hypothetical protein n=1 Tax=Streptomyces sp. NPDC051907 TaxID=3155284 RepID=UPI00342EF29C